MAPRPPADAVVALRSLPRRWRGLFAGLDDDESPDDLAHRPGVDGRSALDHAVHATRSLALLGQALEQTLVSDEPVLDHAAVDASRHAWETLPGVTVDDAIDEAIDELADEANRLAERVDRVPADQWRREVRVAGDGTTVTALDLAWDAVDTAVADLKTAERTLHAVRGR